MVTKVIRKRSFLEMAFNKAKFQDIVDDLIEQIIQNWCLMEYCLLYRNDLNDTYEHWRSELESHMNNISRRVVKGDKRKWIEEIVILQEEFDNPINIYNACKIKFRSENRNGLGITQEQQEKVCNNCSKEIYKIIDSLASQDITIYTDFRFPIL